MCASYDAYVDSLSDILHKHRVHVNRFTFEGEQKLEMEFVGAKLERPKFLEADGTSHEVTPEECHLRNLTYSILLYTDVHVTMHGETHVLPSVYLGRIPLMLGSKYDPNPNLCPFDPSGYFIVKGSEKSIIFQRAHIHNCCLTLHRCLNGSDSYAICCKSEGECVAVTTIKWNGAHALVSFPKLKKEITVGTLLSMLPETGYVKLTEEETQFYKDSLEERSEIIIQDTFELGEPESVRIEAHADVLRASYGAQGGFYPFDAETAVSGHAVETVERQRQFNVPAYRDGARSVVWTDTPPAEQDDALYVPVSA